MKLVRSSRLAGPCCQNGVLWQCWLMLARGRWLTDAIELGCELDPGCLEDPHLCLGAATPWSLLFRIHLTKAPLPAAFNGGGHGSASRVCGWTGCSQGQRCWVCTHGVRG